MSNCASLSQRISKFPKYQKVQEKSQLLLYPEKGDDDDESGDDDDDVGDDNDSERAKNDKRT